MLLASILGNYQGPGAGLLNFMEIDRACRLDERTLANNRGKASYQHLITVCLE